MKTMFCFILALLVFSNKTFGFSIETEPINESTSEYQNPDLRQFGKTKLQEKNMLSYEHNLRIFQLSLKIELT